MMCPMCGGEKGACAGVGGCNCLARPTPYESKYSTGLVHREWYDRVRAERDEARAKYAERDAARAELAEAGKRHREYVRVITAPLTEKPHLCLPEEVAAEIARIIALCNSNADERDAAVKACDDALRLHSVLHDCASESPHMHTLLRDEHSCAVDAINVLRNLVGLGVIERDAARAKASDLRAERDAARAVVEAARNAWSNCDPTSKAFQILDQALRKHDGTESHSIDRFLAAAKGGER